jgi:ADP-heptose:LPS heptosyltransferase
VPKLLQDPRAGHTLVLCPIGIGNFLMATPALRVLSAALGPERVSFLALKSGIGAMARESGFFGKVFTWDPDREGLLKGVKLLSEIRGTGFTHSLALFPTSHWKFSLFHFLAGADFRVGFRYPHQRVPEWVQHHSIPLERMHDTPQNVRLVEAFLRDVVVDPGEPFLPFAPAIPAGLPPEPFFACHPGSSAERGMAEKRLPPDAFATLIRRVHRETGWRCALVGGPEEHALRAAVAMDCKDALVSVETRSLEETAGVLRAARFFLGNDSGLMHVAAAAGTRCAAYFGPTDETRTGPYGYREYSGNPAHRVPRHLILRREGSVPLWTIDTVGVNPVIERTEALARWNLDLPVAWEQLREWVGNLGRA